MTKQPVTLSMLALSTITVILSACGSSPSVPQAQAPSQDFRTASVAPGDCLEAEQIQGEAAGCGTDPVPAPTDETMVSFPDARYWVAINDQSANPWDGTGRAMTWTTIGKASDAAGSYLRPGSDSATDAYRGDTSTSVLLPVACLTRTGLPRPGVLPPTYVTAGGATRSGWTMGDVNFTAAVAGTSLTSRGAADELCAKTFGAGWRMAEFHDGSAADEGRAGWDFWARAVPNPTQARYWIATDDQNANPWSGTGTAQTWTVLDQRRALTWPRFKRYVRVGSDAQSDPYRGDTSTASALPVICLIQTGSPRPGILPPTSVTPGGATRGGWSQGKVEFTSPVQGNTLTSRSDADGLCAKTFGAEYRMAEFHDGGAAGEGLAGWDFWAEAGR